MKEQQKYLVTIDIIFNLMLMVILVALIDNGAPICAWLTTAVAGMIANYILGRKVAKGAPKTDRDNARYYRQHTNYLWFLLPVMFALGVVAFYLNHFIFHQDAALDFMGMIISSLIITTTLELPMVAMYAQGLTYIPRKRRLAIFKDRMADNMATALRLITIDIVYMVILTLAILSALWLPNDGILTTQFSIVTVGEVAAIIALAIAYLIKGFVIRHTVATTPKRTQLPTKRMYIKMSVVSLFVIAIVSIVLLYSIVYFGNSLEIARPIDQMLPLSFALALPLITLTIGYKKHTPKVK